MLEAGATVRRGAAPFTLASFRSGDVSREGRCLALSLRGQRDERGMRGFARRWSPPDDLCETFGLKVREDALAPLLRALAEERRRLAHERRPYVGEST